jgi:hypothetical protein
MLVSTTTTTQMNERAHRMIEKRGERNKEERERREKQ